MPVAVAEPGAVVARVPAAEQAPVVAESCLWRRGGRVASARALGVPPPTLSSERFESWPLVGP